jgi:hypothetical protein
MKISRIVHALVLASLLSFPAAFPGEAEAAPGAHVAASDEASAGGASLLFGIGVQSYHGTTLGGVTADYRLPVLLPFELRPVLGTGFFLNFISGYFSIPATVGVIRAFPLGILNGKSELIAGIAAGVMFTNEAAVDNASLFLAALGWEYQLGNAKAFVQAQAGLRGGGFVLLPRVGVAFPL